MAQEDAKKGLDEIKAIYDDKKMTIDGRDYVFTSTTHAKRKKIFAFLSDVKEMIAVHNYSWMDGQRFDGIEETMGNIILFEDMQVSKIKTHWDDHPTDFVRYIITGMQVISYPFLAGLI
jgi:hypothetical protein